MEAVRTYETSADNHFTRQYIPEDNSEHHSCMLVKKIWNAPNFHHVASMECRACLECQNTWKGKCTVLLFIEEHETLLIAGKRFKHLVKLCASKVAGTPGVSTDIMGVSYKGVPCIQCYLWQDGNWTLWLASSQSCRCGSALSVLKILRFDRKDSITKQHHRH
jgi:hypothetical protein